MELLADQVMTGPIRRTVLLALATTTALLALTACDSGTHASVSAVHTTTQSSPSASAGAVTMGGTDTATAAQPAAFAVGAPGFPATGGNVTLSCSDDATIVVKSHGDPDRTVSCPGDTTWHEGPGPRSFSARPTGTQSVTLTWSTMVAPLQ